MRDNISVNSMFSSKMCLATMVIRKYVSKGEVSGYRREMVKIYSIKIYICLFFLRFHFRKSNN